MNAFADYLYFSATKKDLDPSLIHIMCRNLSLAAILRSLSSDSSPGPSPSPMCEPGSRFHQARKARPKPGPHNTIPTRILALLVSLAKQASVDAILPPANFIRTTMIKMKM